MLSLFRTQTGNVLVGAVVIGIIVVFVLEFRAGRGNPTANLRTQCAVEYDGNCLDQKDYFAAYGLIARNIEPGAARKLGMRKRVLEGLAERELLVAEASRLGLAVPDDVVDRELTEGRALVSLPVADAESLAPRLGLCRAGPPSYRCEPGTTVGVRQLQVSRTEGEPFDYKLYEKQIRILANRGPKEFRAAEEREILANMLRNMVRQRARISDAEAFAIYQEARTRAVARTVVLERSWFEKFAIDTSDAAVQHWAQTNTSQVDEAYKTDKDKFTAGCPVVSEIVVPLPPNALDQEKKDAESKIQALRARLDAGESFESVARDASTADSAAFGGKVGCLNASYGLGSDVLLDAAKKLSPGALSPVVETPRSLVILRLDGKLEAAKLEHAARAQLARGLYLHFAADHALRAFATDLIQKAKAGAKLEDVTRALTDEIARAKAPAPKGKPEASSPPGLSAPDRPRFEVSAPFGAQGPLLPEVEAKESLAARAFALDKPDTVAEQPIETTTGLVVLQLKDKTPATREGYEKEKWALLAGLQQAKGDEALVRYVAELRKKAGKDLKVDPRFAEESKTDSAED